MILKYRFFSLWFSNIDSSHHDSQISILFSMILKTTGLSTIYLPNLKVKYFCSNILEKRKGNNFEEIDPQNFFFFFSFFLSFFLFCFFFSLHFLFWEHFFYMITFSFLDGSLFFCFTSRNIFFSNCSFFRLGAVYFLFFFFTVETFSPFYADRIFFRVGYVIFFSILFSHFLVELFFFFW